MFHFIRLGKAGAVYSITSDDGDATSGVKAWPPGEQMLPESSSLLRAATASMQGAVQFIKRSQKSRHTAESPHFEKAGNELKKKNTASTNKKCVGWMWPSGCQRNKYPKRGDVMC